MPTPPTEKKTLVDKLTAALPTVVQIANNILGVEIVTYRQIEDGGVVVITSQGQKFTFTAEEIDAPTQAKARLKRDKVKVFKQLPHGRIRLPERDEADDDE